MIAQTEAATLTSLEKACEAFDAEAAALDEMISALDNDLAAVKQKHLSALRRQAARVASREAELRAGIEGNPELFVKPRTYVFNGVKIGYTTSAGKLEFDDEENVVALIVKHFKDRRDELVRDNPKLLKDAIKRLKAEEQEKIGCRIDGAGDVVIVKRTAGDVEKLIDKLIEKLVEAMVTTKEAA